MTAHTPGLLDYDGGECCEITAESSHIGPHGYACAQLVAIATEEADLNDGDDGLPPRSSDEAKANAARLVACWNACDGMPDPAKEIEFLRESYEKACHLPANRVSALFAQRDALLSAVNKLAKAGPLDSNDGVDTAEQEAAKVAVVKARAECTS